ncbi:MAG: T9SS type A sorting domain-containing protein [Bacteroidetes bacterium]|nr:T9SS type A sorting domain-containing protein [Bacteroidota bacterium]
MKNLLLSGSAMFLFLGAANAQGWETKGAHDDFATADIYVNGPNNEGVYWWETTNGTSLAITRSGNGAMSVLATNAGGCTGLGCYPSFGVDFGTVNSLPVTLDLSTGANIVLDIENKSSNFTFISVILTDVNGKEAKFEPNVSDVTVGSTWDNPERKSLNGFTFGNTDGLTTSGKERKTVTIDLSSVAGKVGGLTGGAYSCDPGPFNCPATTYEIDITKIKSVLFMVNFGKDNIFISEGDGDHTADTFIEAKNISAFSGEILVHDFKIGKLKGESVGVNTFNNNTLNVYPNPTNDVMNVTFDATSKSTITLTDLFGRVVYSASINEGTQKIAINSSNFATGMYVLNLTTSEGTVSQKVNIK